MSEETGKSRPFLVAAVIIFTPLVFILSVVSKGTIEGSIKTELGYMIETYGYQPTEAIYNKAVDSSELLMEGSGLLGGLRKLLLPEEYFQYGGVGDTTFFTTSFWSQVDEAIDNLSLNVEYFLLRLYGLSVWLILSAVILVAAVFSGYMVREIKKQGG